MLNQNFFAELSELICTRISHDLIGNIGAVANAVELMDEDPEALDDAKPILSVSSKVLTARLKFFLFCFFFCFYHTHVKIMTCFSLF